MACGCTDETVLDTMAKVKTTKNKVISKLLDALAELDNQRAEENPIDLIRIQEYRQMHGKIEAILKYVQQRIDAPVVNEKSQEATS